MVNFYICKFYFLDRAHHRTHPRSWAEGRKVQDVTAVLATVNLVGIQIQVFFLSNSIVAGAKFVAKIVMLLALLWLHVTILALNSVE